MGCLPAGYNHYGQVYEPVFTFLRIVVKVCSPTVRLWIMRGFMEDTIRQRHDVALEFIGRAREVLQWGIQTWSDVPQEDKGAIFTASFLQGVHSLYLDSYMKVGLHWYSPMNISLPKLEVTGLRDDAFQIQVGNSSQGGPSFVR